MSGEEGKRVAELERELGKLRARLEQIDVVGDELNQKIFDSVHAGVVRVAADGSIELANRLGLEFLGLEFDELTGKYTADFKALREDGEVADWEEFPVTVALRSGQPAGPVTYGVVRPDQSIRWGLFKAVPIVAGGGEVQGAVVSFTDITARREVEAKLRDSEALLTAILKGS
ncbi:MAG: PAS domain-containing protein, partial [Deltaproteobacteria bacterium]|nr:PAS domain-containing protein [Deltaproteobacteria bacterium]